MEKEVFNRSLLEEKERRRDNHEIYKMIINDPKGRAINCFPMYLDLQESDENKCGVLEVFENLGSKEGGGSKNNHDNIRDYIGNVLEVIEFKYNEVSIERLRNINNELYNKVLSLDSEYESLTSEYKKLEGKLNERKEDE